jgi:hypothetical protein
MISNVCLVLDIAQKAQAASHLTYHSPSINATLSLVIAAANQYIENDYADTALLSGQELLGNASPAAAALVDEIILTGRLKMFNQVLMYGSKRGREEESKESKSKRNRAIAEAGILGLYNNQALSRKSWDRRNEVRDLGFN